MSKWAKGLTCEEAALKAVGLNFASFNEVKREIDKIEDNHREIELKPASWEPMPITQEDERIISEERKWIKQTDEKIREANEINKALQQDALTKETCLNCYLPVYWQDYDGSLDLDKTLFTLNSLGVWFEEYGESEMAKRIYPKSHAIPQKSTLIPSRTMPITVKGKARNLAVDDTTEFLLKELSELKIQVHKSLEEHKKLEAELNSWKDLVSASFQETIKNPAATEINTPLMIIAKKIWKEFYADLVTGDEQPKSAVIKAAIKAIDDKLEDTDIRAIYNITRINKGSTTIL